MNQKRYASPKRQSPPPAVFDATPAEPVLRFSPGAWAKLLWFRDRGDTEIGGFGISSPRDPLRIEQFITLRQRVSVATVAFEDDAVAGFFERQVEAGLRPERFARIGCHTQIAASSRPSTGSFCKKVTVLGR